MKRIYQAAVTTGGIGLWLAAVVHLTVAFPLIDDLILLALVPLVIFVGMLPQKFPLPLGLKFTQERFSFSLSDAIILLVACWYGLMPAVFLAGLEGFFSSRRAGTRLSSNLFSFGMMSLAAGASAAVLNLILHFSLNRPGVTDLNRAFLVTSIAMLAASLVHTLVNCVLLSTFLALRHGDSILSLSKKNFMWAAPMFLPTGAAASLMFLALSHGILTTIVIGGTVLAALHFWHRQHRNGVQERVGILEKAHRETIEALAVAINAKDEVTHDHVLRVQIYAAGVARILGCKESEVEALKAGALLHDIGKIAVPDYILNKPGKLTAAEFEQMKLHTIVGAQIIGRVEFPYPVVPIVRHHHERWDGKGYPDGLSGENIPLIARILSVVDCFDAVREDRQYRKGLTRDEAINLIMEGSGTQYDPRVVGTFVTHLPEFEAEIQSKRNTPLPTYGIEAFEQLSEAARQVPPAAGLAEETESTDPAGEIKLTQKSLRKLFDLAQAVGGARDRQTMLTAFTARLNALVPYNTCAVMLVAPESGDYTVAHATGEHAAALRGRRIVRGEGVTGWVVANRKPFCNTDPKLDLPPMLAEQFAAYRTLAAFPLIHDRETHGAVTLYSSVLAEYNQDQQRLLEHSVALLATALSKVSQPDARAAAEASRPAAGINSLTEPAGADPLISQADGAFESALTH